jgi:YVTN family beta-propeller protein
MLSLPVAATAAAFACTGETVKVGAGPKGIAVNPATNTVYVAEPDSVEVIDGSTNHVIASIPLGEAANGYGIAVNPATGRLYVAGRSTDSVYVIDTVKNKVVKTIPMAKAPIGIAVNPVTHMVYVANSESGKSESLDMPVDDDFVSVIDGATDHVVANIDVGGFDVPGAAGPTSVAVDTGTNLVYVGG